MTLKTYDQLSENCRRHIDAAILVDAANAVQNPFADTDPRRAITAPEVTDRVDQLRALYTREMQSVSPRFEGLTQSKTELSQGVSWVSMVIGLGGEYQSLEPLFATLGFTNQAGIAGVGTVATPQARTR